MSTPRVRRALNRRHFLMGGLAAAAPWGAAPAPAAPGDRITVGIIGTGNQGFNILRQFLRHPEAQVVAVCDVNRAGRGYRDESQYLGREPARAAVNQHYARRQKSGRYDGCAAYRDFRDLLGRKDLDAVAIVTPDHWHAPMTIMAARAGKDVYCEKPLSLTIRQGREMVRAVRRHGRILQTGSHERSNPVTRFACELVRNGRIGELKKVITFVGYHNKVGPGPGWRPMPVPDGFDYDTWLGPAPPAPYHRDRCLYRFRFIYDYSGGQVTNYGAHSNDIAQWAMDTEHTGPVEVECLDAKFLPEGSLFDAATESTFRCRYAGGVELVCTTDRSSMGARFVGTEGTVQVGYGGFFTEPASLRTSVIGPNELHLYPSVDHVGNFLDCVRSRREPAAPVNVGHRSASLCHLGAIAIRLWRHGHRKVLRWDPRAERFTGDDDANAMLARPMRKPWTM